MSTIDRLFFSVIACFFFVAGGLLISSALEGADILPHHYLREEVFYTAHQAVLQLLLGQALDVIGLFIAWFFVKK